MALHSWDLSWDLPYLLQLLPREDMTASGPYCPCSFFSSQSQAQSQPGLSHSHPQQDSAGLSNALQMWREGSKYHGRTEFRSAYVKKRRLGVPSLPALGLVNISSMPGGGVLKGYVRSPTFYWSSNLHTSHGRAGKGKVFWE